MMRIQILAKVIWWYMHVVFAELQAEFVLFWVSLMHAVKGGVKG